MTTNIDQVEQAFKEWRTKRSGKKEHTPDHHARAHV